LENAEEIHPENEEITIDEESFKILKKQKIKEKYIKINQWANPQKFNMYLSESIKFLEKGIKRTSKCCVTTCLFKLIFLEKNAKKSEFDSIDEIKNTLDEYIPTHIGHKLDYEMKDFFLQK